jgi:phage terminase small subunit
MSDKLTPKQEKFCQKYIELGNASEAYRAAYDCKRSTDKTVWESASKLMADPKVSARITSLQALHQKRHEVTVDSITRELDEDRALARQLKQPAPAITAVLGKAKLHGLLEDKVTIKRKLEDLSEEELIALARSKGLIDREDSDHRGAGKKGT